MKRPPPTETWDPEVNLEESGLDSAQKDAARKLLREECGAFSRNDEDIGCAPDLRMDIRLTEFIHVNT